MNKKWIIVPAIIVALAVGGRLALPYIVLRYVNNTLAHIKDYDGHVGDIDIALIRGAYTIRNLQLTKIDTIKHEKDTIPFFTSPRIDFSVEWRAIFKGSVVGEINVEKPVLNFVKGKHQDEDPRQDTTDFKEVIRKLMPLTINHFTIRDGEIHFIDNYSSPKLNVPMHHINVKADNLSNVNESKEPLPSTITASGNAYDGSLSLDVRLNALEKQPTFDLNAEISNVNMLQLNDFFQAYGKFRVEKGNFGLYTEFAAKDGAFKGYVKPLIKDMKVAKEGNAVQIAWQTIVAGAGELLENQRKDQIATKLPVEGRFDNPDAGLWTAISYVLRNAFVFALQPSVDNTIDIGKVEEQPKQKSLLQKVFGGKDKDTKPDTKKKKP